MSQSVYADYSMYLERIWKLLNKSSVLIFLGKTVQMNASLRKQ